MHNCFKETAETFLSSTGLQLPVDYNMDVDKRKGIYLKVNTETFIYIIWEHIFWKQPLAEMQGKAAYIIPKVVGPFLGPCASGSYVHRADLLHGATTTTTKPYMGTHIYC
jgi:hypothetical protein